MFQKIILILTLLFSGILGASAASVDPWNLPPLTQYVTDFSGVIPAERLENLQNIAKSHDEKKGEQAVTVLFPNRGGRELIDLGVKIFRDNKIGNKKTNKGILLLIATDEKKIRIVTGYGMEGDYPDVLVKRIIEEKIRPEVNAGNYDKAVEAFYQTLASKEEFAATPAKKNDDVPDGFGYSLFFLFLGFLSRSFRWFLRETARIVFHVTVFLIAIIGAAIAALFGSTKLAIFFFIGIFMYALGAFGKPGKRKSGRFWGGGFWGGSWGGWFSGGGGSTGGGWAGD